MTTHPILINRPIVVTPKGVRLCRPSETVLDILSNSDIGRFVKEVPVPAIGLPRRAGQTDPEASPRHTVVQFKPVEHRGPVRPIGQHDRAGRTEGGWVVEGAGVDGVLRVASVLAAKYQTTACRTR